MRARLPARLSSCLIDRLSSIYLDSLTASPKPLPHFESDSGFKFLLLALTLTHLYITNLPQRRREDEISITDGVLELSTKFVEEVMTPMEDVVTLFGDTVHDNKLVSRYDPSLHPPSSFSPSFCAVLITSLISLSLFFRSYSLIPFPWEAPFRE
ncbi:hypothetical protein B0H11DRAFT_857129 [Mycena galericulata]|nr:hypothetical protein B0H11DRAFT_857129 [Mycena galericulata]